MHSEWNDGDGSDSKGGGSIEAKKKQRKKMEKNFSTARSSCMFKLYRCTYEHARSSIIQRHSANIPATCAVSRLHEGKIKLKIMTVFQSCQQRSTLNKNRLPRAVS